MQPPPPWSYQMIFSYGYQTFVNSEAGQVFGAYRSFLEVVSFVIFLGGFLMNSVIFITLITAYRTLESLDGFLINLMFGELLASFSLAFVMFYQFAAGKLYSMGDSGCSLITWLNVTSICITVTSIIAVIFTLYNKLFYGNSYRLTKLKLIGCICLTWIVASLPGLPYLTTAKMGDGYCYITKWSNGAEVLYICMMIVFQIVLPLCLLVYLFVRIFLALRVSPSDDGDIVLSEESTPGTEANFQRAVIKQQVKFVLWMTVMFYILLIISSFIALAIQLNINNIKGNRYKYSRLRQLASLFQCAKCLVIPMFYLLYYEKLRGQLKKFSCRRNQEMYKNLRYSVYEQTVEETPSDPLPSRISSSSNRNSRASITRDDDAFETDRDDVAILQIGR